jgi:hypothetical protein
MKKTCCVLALPCALILSCASRPPVNQPPPLVEQQPVKEAAAPPAPPPSVQPSVEMVYAKYSADIILEGARPYRVVRGDTLTKIAKRQYGSGNGYYFPLILLASRNTTGDPDLIIPGTQLTVPDLWRNLDDPGARQKIRAFLNEIAGIYDHKRGKKWGIQTRNQLQALASSL